MNTINRDEIYKEIKALNAQREKLLDLYLDGLIEKHVYTQRENKINTRIEELKKNIDNDFTNKITNLKKC